MRFKEIRKMKRAAEARNTPAHKKHINFHYVSFFHEITLRL
jgi:hypothetical protein